MSKREEKALAVWVPILVSLGVLDYRASRTGGWTLSECFRALRRRLEDGGEKFNIKDIPYPLVLAAGCAIFWRHSEHD